jgi:hypothetical protein
MRGLSFLKQSKAPETDRNVCTAFFVATGISSAEISFFYGLFAVCFIISKKIDFINRIGAENEPVKKKISCVRDTKTPQIVEETAAMMIICCFR